MRQPTGPIALPTKRSLLDRLRELREQRGESVRLTLNTRGAVVVRSEGTVMLSDHPGIYFLTHVVGPVAGAATLFGSISLAAGLIASALAVALVIYLDPPARNKVSRPR
jgi:hypothetical protein